MRFAFSIAALLALPRILFGWDYAGHRTVNALALATLPPEFPQFVQNKEARERVTFLSGEPDRWRNSADLPLRHANNPDHYIDLEGLAWANFTPETLPDQRYVFAAEFALARQNHPERFPADREESKDHREELIGFLPWAIVENYDKLRSAFSYLKAYQEAGSDTEIANAEANVIYAMGLLGHYVGDGSQPLHTTLQNNGWVGPNPRNFTTSKRFHAWIDGGFFQKTGGIYADTLKTQVRRAHLLTTKTQGGERDPIFSQTMAYLVQHYQRGTELYELDKEGQLSPENPRDGRRFLERQILDGAEMLGDLWFTAWRDAPPDAFLRGALLDRQLKHEASKN